MSVPESLRTAVLSLPRADQMDLAVELFSLASPDLSDVTEDEWLAELDRRYEEFKHDPSVGVPWSELMANG